MSIRKPYFDFLRGIAILMVIGIHTFVAEGISVAGFEFSLFVRQLLNVAVPLFLALSAFFLFGKPLYEKDSVLAFWRKQIPKVYIPAVLWSIPFFVMNLSSGGGYLGGTVRLFTCGFSVYYFVALIIQYYLLLPVFQYFKPNAFRVGISILVSCLSICIVTYLNIVKGLNLPLLLYAGPFILWVAFYYLGCVMSFGSREYSLLFPIICTLLGLFLSCGETQYLVTHFQQGYGIKLSSFIYSYGMILLLFSYKLERSYKISFLGVAIEWLGKNSFIIYLVHVYVITVLKGVFSLNSWSLFWILVVLLSSTVVFVLRFLPQKIRYYLGVF